MCASAPALAIPLQITESPQEHGGGFTHNVFHSANSVTGGSILAWYDLNTSGLLDFYDPDTGALQADFIIYANIGLTTQVGTAVAMGTGLTAALLNGASGVEAGTIAWEITLLDNGNAFVNYMMGKVLDPTDFTLTMTFLSDDFAISALGYVANSYEQHGDTFFLTLWGANGFSGGSYGSGTYLGTDLVVDPTYPVPEPSTLAIFAFGLAGLGFMTRRRRGALAA